MDLKLIHLKNFAQVDAHFLENNLLVVMVTIQKKLLNE